MGPAGIIRRVRTPGLDLLRAGVRLARSPAGDRRRALEAAAQLTRASLELRLVRSGRAARLLGRIQSGHAGEPAGGELLREAEAVGRAVTGVARRLPWHPTCLRQALAAQRMLRRRSIPSLVHLGVTSATLGEAHAWVTVDGLPVVGRAGVERFVPLAAFR